MTTAVPGTEIPSGPVPLYDGAILLSFSQTKQVLDRLKRLCVGMEETQRQLAAAVASVVGKVEERAVASLFTPGGTHALEGEFAGVSDFEVVAFLVVVAGRDVS